MKEDIRKARAAIIAELNDEFRETGQGGRVVISRGVWQQNSKFVAQVVTEVRSYLDFTADNDPDWEHNAGSFAVAGKTVNWKIDYYDASGEWPSSDPANPDITMRSLTTFLAEED